MQILIDDREKRKGWTFDDYDCETTHLRLTTGDYISADTYGICVERKSLEDLANTLRAGKGRFIKELERMQSFRRRLLIVECNIQDIYDKKYVACIHPDALVLATLELTVKYGVGFMLAGSPKQAEHICYNYFEAYYSGAVRVCRQLGL